MGQLQKIIVIGLLTLGLFTPTIALLGDTPVYAACDTASCLAAQSGACQTDPTGCTKDPNKTVNNIITTIVNVLSLIVGVVAVIMIIIGGLRYVISGGDSGNVTSAKNTILYAIVGLVIVALAQVIVQFVLKRV